ncbi:hypothetical protein [Prochlorococcus sp. ALOHA_ZT_50]|jgi:hypothetical protein|uniref:hypothetical protein n=1 Tax=Prochlorococcus sp. ALOHA_ZT_50 TaxID=2919303 RepID=UPI00257F3BCC|nr:hypothetical protein [Prochlorococcus sp. ALOHA_ZT_50]MCH2079638.1 hypothetical protein [Prochlorococcus sp. ALOHA_ZT_50]
MPRFFSAADLVDDLHQLQHSYQFALDMGITYENISKLSGRLRHPWCLRHPMKLEKRALLKQKIKDIDRLISYLLENDTHAKDVYDQTWRFWR